MATELRLGIESLRSGDAAAAVSHLRAVADDEILAAAADLRDIHARATSLLAQALLEHGEFEDARLQATRALELCRSIADESGVGEIEELLERVSAADQQRITDERRERSLHRLANMEASEIRRLYGRDRRALADVMLKKASADLAAGRASDAEAAAREVLTEAIREDWRREEVLARLSIARIVPSEAEMQLNAAWRRAERDSDHTLVSTVARAANLADIGLPSMLGPDMGGSVD